MQHRHPLLGRGQRRRIAVSLLVVVAALLALRLGVFDFATPHTVARADVENEAETALIHSGVAASRVNCPGDLERRTGASMVCSYTDAVSEGLGIIVDPGNPNRRPADKGRFEVRISGFDRRYVARKVWSTPKFEVRVVDPAE